MLEVKFQAHRTSSSGEDFCRVLTIYGHGCHLGYVTWTIYINFLSPFPRRLHMKFGVDWPSGFSFVLFRFLLNVQVNNCSVMSGRSHCFLGTTSGFSEEDI